MRDIMEIQPRWDLSEFSGKARKKNITDEPMTDFQFKAIFKIVLWAWGWGSLGAATLPSFPYDYRKRQGRN